MAVRYILIFAILVSAAAGCCFPERFVTYIDIYSANAKNNITLTTQTLEYGFDSINHKIMISYSNGRKNIYDYSKGVIYMQFNSSYCRSYNMNLSKLKKICLTSLISGKPIGHYNLGAGKLPFTAYGYRNVSNSVASGWVWSLSEGCLPIAATSYSNSSRNGYVSATLWTNMKVDFNSTILFQPSQHCSSPTSSKRHNIQFDLMDEINSKSGRPLNKKETKIINKVDKYVDQMEMKRQQEKLRYEEEMRIRQEERRRQEERQIYERMAELERERQDDDDADDDFDWK